MTLKQKAQNQYWNINWDDDILGDELSTSCNIGPVVSIQKLQYAERAQYWISFNS